MINLEQLPQGAFTIAQKAIDSGFSIDKSNGNIHYVRLFKGNGIGRLFKGNGIGRLFKGNGIGRLLLLVGRMKVYFMVQIGDSILETAELNRLRCKTDNEKALHYLGGPFLSVNVHSFDKYVPKKSEL